MAEHVRIDVGYLPLPNTVEVVFTDRLAPEGLTRTAFMIALHDDGSIQLAANKRRGSEVPGGHVEDGETLLEAALRETMEEIGCEVDDVVPIGYLRMTSMGDVPDDYDYPHPVGYQQFFAGRISKQHEYVPNDECDFPIRQSAPHYRKQELNVFWMKARQILGL